MTVVTQANSLTSLIAVCCPVKLAKTFVYKPRVERVCSCEVSELLFIWPAAAV